MWSNKYASGPMPPTAFIRSVAGTVGFYEAETREGQGNIQRDISAVSASMGAKIETLKLNAFDASGVPHYLLRVEVVTPGREAKRRGRQPALPDGVQIDPGGRIRDKRFR